MKKTKKYLAIALVLILCLSLTACSASVDGYYESLDGEYGYKFTKTGFNEGTYDRYSEGELVEREEYIRNTNTWEQDGDVLTRTNDRGYNYYYKVYDDCLIEIDYDGDEPRYWDYIAPTGNRFEYEISDYEFYKDGTFVEEGIFWDDEGEYYRSQNVIYIKYDGYTEYSPLYYIYNGDHIIPAEYVLVKDTFTRQIGNWFDSLIHR